MLRLAWGICRGIVWIVRRTRWRHIRAMLIIGLFLSIILPLPTHGSDCQGSPLPPRLIVGSVARVAFQTTHSLSLRTFPGQDARLLSPLTPGTPLNVVRGPTCVGGIHWWQLQTLRGQTGWAAEGFPKNALYALEPWGRLVDVAHRTAEGYSVVRLSAGGRVLPLTEYRIATRKESLSQLWPPGELDLFRADYWNSLRGCPSEALQTNSRYPLVTSVGEFPADEGHLTAYPSPDGTRVLIVRHLWHAITGCDGRRVQRGIDQVSLSTNAQEQLLFEVPASAQFSDVFQIRPPSTTHNRIVEIRWSPNGARAVAWVHYGVRDRLYMIEANKGTLSEFDEGLHPVWLADGKRLAWLRPDYSTQSQPVVTLVQASYQNTGRQTIALPPELEYLNAPIAPLWNQDGTRLLACFRADDCQTLIPIDIPNRQALPSLQVPVTTKRVYWSMGDQALLWSPTEGGQVIRQDLNGDIHPYTIPLNSGESLDSMSLFADGTEVALVIQRSDGTYRYAILDLTEARVKTIN